MYTEYLCARNICFMFILISCCLFISITIFLCSVTVFAAGIIIIIYTAGAESSGDAETYSNFFKPTAFS